MGGAGKSKEAYGEGGRRHGEGDEQLEDFLLHGVDVTGRVCLMSSEGCVRL